MCSLLTYLTARDDGKCAAAYKEAKGSHFSDKLARLCHTFWNVVALKIEKFFYLVFLFIACLSLLGCKLYEVSFVHHYISIAHPGPGQIRVE